MDFFKCDLQEVYDIVKHHYDVLGKAAKLRPLEDFEIEFSLLKPLFDCDIITENDFRKGVDKYFNS